MPNTGYCIACAMARHSLRHCTCCCTANPLRMALATPHHLLPHGISLPSVDRCCTARRELFHNLCFCVCPHSSMTCVLPSLLITTCRTAAAPHASSFRVVHRFCVHGIANLQLLLPSCTPRFAHDPAVLLLKPSTALGSSQMHSWLLAAAAIHARHCARSTPAGGVSRLEIQHRT